MTDTTRTEVLQTFMVRAPSWAAAWEAHDVFGPRWVDGHHYGDGDAVAMPTRDDKDWDKVIDVPADATAPLAALMELHTKVDELSALTYALRNILAGLAPLLVTAGESLRQDRIHEEAWGD